MKPIGPRLRTDTRFSEHLRHRPGRLPGRSRILRRALFVALVALVLPLLTQVLPASAFELLAWWRRDLLALELEPGDWARFALRDVSEDGAVTDTLTVTVLAAAEPSQRWLRIEGGTDEPADYLLLAVDRLGPDDQPLDAVVRLVRRTPDGAWHEEDLADHRESRLVQRHLQDPFVDPSLERFALGDSLAHGRTLRRERVILSEVQREERTAGRNVLVIETRLRAVATLSPEVPLVGLLEAETTTLVSTSTETPDGQRIGRGAPPLLGERTLRCLEFGRLQPAPTEIPPR